MEKAIASFFAREEMVKGKMSPARMKHSCESEYEFYLFFSR